MTNSESMGTFHTEWNTPRRASRVFPDSPLVICFPSGNRGIVLDISPGGVGFLAGASLEEDNPICFTISGKSAPMTEAAGELMWKDSASKRAGVRFTHVSEGLRTLINHSQHGQSKHGHSQHDKNKPSRTLEAGATPVSQANKVTAPLPSTRKKFGVAANAMTAALSLFMAVAIWFPLDRHGLLGSMKALEHAASQLVSAARTYRMELADAHPAGGPQGGPLVADSHASSLGPVLPRVATTHGAAPARARRGGVQTARRPSRQTHGGGSEDIAESPESLWQAVEKGSSAAEIKLADMYLQAKGVEKSCSQAEVLLAAAQRHKSALAVRKLADVAGYGCE